MRFPRARAARLWLTANALATWSGAPAKAEEAFELVWQAPPGCPQRAKVREQIDELVPQAMLERGRLRAEGAITRVGARFRLRLVMRLGDVTGERSIDAESCGDLAGAAAVALGLLLQSATPSDAYGAPTTPTDAAPTGSGSPVAVRADAQAEKPLAPPVSRNDQEREAEPERDADASRVRSWRAFIAPQATLDVGPLPRPAFGAALSAGVRFQHWELMAGGRLPVEQRVDLARGLGAELTHFSLTIAACRAFAAQPLELTPCLAIGLEHLSATGAGPVEAPQRANATWVSVGADAWGRWYVADWLALAVGVGGRVQAARPRVEIAGISETERLSPVALLLRVGPVLVF